MEQQIDGEVGAAESGVLEHPEHRHHENRHFFYSVHRLEAPRSRLTVRELKEVIARHVQGFNLEHVLVLEERGDRPDKPLADSDEVHLDDFPHFYDQPPANFGRA
jgi:hypothetical protein